MQRYYYLYVVFNLRHMKRTIFYPLIIIMISLSSCDTLIKESEAVLKNNQGLEYLNNGQTDLAVIEFKSAANLTSNKDLKASYLRNLAVAYHHEEEMDSSRFYSLQAAMLHDENTVHYLINMASVNLIDGEVNKAIPKLEDAIEIGAEGVEAYNSLGLIYYGYYGLEYQNLDKAITYNEKAYEINEDRITGDILARTYYEAEQYDKAERHFNRLKTDFPDMLEYSYYLGLIKYNTGSKIEAKHILNQVVQKDSMYYYGIEHILDE